MVPIVACTYGSARKLRYNTSPTTDSFTDGYFQFISSAVLSGHEDWVKALAFRLPEAEGDPLVLASGSQDATIRLWNVEATIPKATEASTSAGNRNDELLDAFEASLGDLGDGEEGGRQISLKRHVLTVKTGENRYCAPSSKNCVSDTNCNPAHDSSR